MEQELFILLKRVNGLEKRVCDLENKNYKNEIRKSHYESISKEIIIDILNQAIPIGTIKENTEEYVLDKKIVHSIIYEKNIRKYDFNKSLKEMDFVIGQKSQNLAYKQVRVKDDKVWAYVINKGLFKKAVEEIEYGR